MLLGITNTPNRYAWGSRTAIADLLGREASGAPEAELWLGAHPADPSVVQGDGDPTLDAWISAHPGSAGAGRDALPFLMKVLAADRPLSLQVHPDAAQAAAGFARENEAGIALDAPARNYRDPNPKPEMILALSAVFEALVGFRPVAETRLLLAELAAAAGDAGREAVTALADRLADPDESAGLRDAVGWLLARGDEVLRLVGIVVVAVGRTSARSSFAREWATVEALAQDYPEDPAVVISLLMNRVSLAQGLALAMPAGMPHAYLSGLGIELMASSDNVLRGGLTAKHVDVPELMRILRFDPAPAPVVRPDSPGEGIEVYRTTGEDFVLAAVAVGDAGWVHGQQVTGPESVSFRLDGPAIALALNGSAVLTGERGSRPIQRGEAAFVTPDERELTISGSASLVIATMP